VNLFVGRNAEIKGIEQFLHPSSSKPRRKIHVIHGLGGIGKTQLAIEFARKHHDRYSAVFWLEASSKDSLSQALADIALRLPQAELTADTIQELRNAKIDVGAVARGVLQWLSLPSNRHWLLIFDNMDLDHTLKDKYPQAYNPEEFFPSADHGSIIITSRLLSLQRYGTGSKLGAVDDEEAMAILENNVGRPLKGGRCSYLRFYINELSNYLCRLSTCRLDP
jgi:hypothetical protein